jgi:arylsulfatase A-like enzyme/HEAT repeat protein
VSYALPEQPPEVRPTVSGLRRGLCAGGALALVEVALVLAYGRELFLSVGEMLRYLVLAASALPALCALVGLFVARMFGVLARGAGGDREAYLRQVRLLVMTASAPLALWTLWLLTSGRRVHAIPGRTPIVIAASLLTAWAAGRIVVALVRSHEAAPRRPARAAGLMLLAAAAVAADAYLLRRLYPAFHNALAGLSVLLVVAAAAFAPAPRRSPSAPVGIVIAAVCAAVALLSLRSLVSAPNARFAIREAAPLSGKLLRLASELKASMPQPEPIAPEPPPPAVQHVGIDLQGRDVLLITVDALRTDRLRAYGGSGLTPAIDALAAQSAVFLRAYTPTPHTSYAIASLFTGKFMQPLLSLAETKDDHATLPQLLRHHGYRTAAFYPPAIFFVDEERFDWLNRDHLGFEYVKAMFAPAQDRVAQLQEYLAEVDAGHPLLVWVHLFEPHEPYDPPPAFARGTTPILRYDGEVAAADAAVGKLVSAFRKARPGATVILTADHGEEFGDHGGHHHGTTLFDEQVRVPVLWSSPGQVKARSISAPIEIVDLTTTLLAALGIPREARMRGDDLGPLLAGEAAPARMHAFASIDGARMIADQRSKLICGESECQLFDLLEDPGERRDLAEERGREVAALRGELASFVASLPRHEALAMSGGGAWPDALARARLGDASAAPELVPLLSSPRADVRAAAARAVGELEFSSARNVLSRMYQRDADADVRAEAAIAALRLGDRAALPPALGLLAGAPEPARRAALALAGQGDGSGEAILIAAALDASLEEPERLAALRALAAQGSKLASRALLPLLDDVRLRAETAITLGRIGDRSAVAGLLRALRVERYPEARRAEAQALIALGARAPALALIRRFLGTSSSLPDGVGLLRDAGALAAANGAGADLVVAAHVRQGAWQCESKGCRPTGGAAIALPEGGAPRGEARVTVRARVEGTSRLLRLSDKAHHLNEGVSEVGWSVADARALVVKVEADTGVWLQAIAVVPAVDDVPPPAPEPPVIADRASAAVD